MDARANRIGRRRDTVEHALCQGRTDAMSQLY
jgi:hypothetical protein